MNEPELAAKQEQLSVDRTKLERERLEFEQKKLQRLTVAVSTVAVIVSLLQVAVAFLQSRLTTAQTVERFIPHLQKQETRDAALLTMSVFTDHDFVTQLAEKLKATGVLETLQSRGSDQEKAKASEALSALDTKRKRLIEQMFDTDKQKRIEATTELVRQWVNDPKIIPQIIDIAGPQSSNQSGIVNSLVVLRETQPEALRAYSEELLPFMEKVKANGPQTASLVAQVQEKSALMMANPSIK